MLHERCAIGVNSSSWSYGVLRLVELALIAASGFYFFDYFRRDFVQACRFVQVLVAGLSRLFVDHLQTKDVRF